MSIPMLSSHAAGVNSNIHKLPIGNHGQVEVR